MRIISLIFTILTVVLITTSAMAGTLINRENGNRISSTCLKYYQKNRCILLEVRIDNQDGSHATLELKGDRMIPPMYSEFDALFFYFTLTVPEAMGDNLPMVLSIPLMLTVGVPIGFSIDLFIRAPVLLVEKIVDERLIHLIRLIFDFESTRIKTVSHKKFLKIQKLLFHPDKLRVWR